MQALSKISRSKASSTTHQPCHSVQQPSFSVSFLACKMGSIFVSSTRKMVKIEEKLGKNDGQCTTCTTGSLLSLSKQVQWQEPLIQNTLTSKSSSYPEHSESWKALASTMLVYSLSTICLIVLKFFNYQLSYSMSILKACLGFFS